LRKGTDDAFKAPFQGIYLEDIASDGVRREYEVRSSAARASEH
jgi:hypothetical protein